MKITLHLGELIAIVILTIISGYLLRGYVNNEIPREERLEFCRWVWEPKTVSLQYVRMKNLEYCEPLRKEKLPISRAK